MRALPRRPTPATADCGVRRRRGDDLDGLAAEPACVRSGTSFLSTRAATAWLPTSVCTAVGEVERGGVARQRQDVALRREQVDLVREQVDLDVFEEFERRCRRASGCPPGRATQSLRARSARCCVAWPMVLYTQCAATPRSATRSMSSVRICTSIGAPYGAEQHRVQRSGSRSPSGSR